MPIKIDYVFRVMMLLSECQGLPQLPVSLAIQLISPDEYRAGLLGRAEKDQVRRYALILMDLDDVADLQVR